MTSLVNGFHGELSATRAQRIRAAIFPEIFPEEAINGHSAAMFNGHGSAVQKLSEPSQLLKNAVIDIINYKEDAELTEKALPELIRLLNDSDPAVAGQAALILHSLAKKEASRSALATSTALMPALAQSMSNARATDDLRRGVAGVLHCLSQYPQGLQTLLKGATIPLLVKLLEFVSFRLVSLFDRRSCSSLVRRSKRSSITRCQRCTIFSCIWNNRN